MGQAPASGKISLRTMPRNFPGRSGTLDDQVYLCSPETATASALTGEITDPRTLEQTHGIAYPDYREPDRYIINTANLVAPSDDGSRVELVKGPNVGSLPELAPLESEFSIPVELVMDDNISTDEILRAGAEVLPLRSNIPEISKWAFYVVDRHFYDRALKAKKQSGGHVVVAGENYAQGSSREHAAIAPRYLGQRAVIAKSYARIGWQNLVNFGIVPFEFVDRTDYEGVKQGDILELPDVREEMQNGTRVTVHNATQGTAFSAEHRLNPRQVEIVLRGGVIEDYKT